MTTSPPARSPGSGHWNGEGSQRWLAHLDRAEAVAQVGPSGGGAGVDVSARITAVARARSAGAAGLELHVAGAVTAALPGSGDAAAAERSDWLAVPAAA